MVVEADHLHGHQRSRIVPGMSQFEEEQISDELVAYHEGGGEQGQQADRFPGEEEELDDDEGDGAGEEEDAVSINTGQSSQLTLSYQGEVYVFDNVAADKVQTVLMVLGGQEVAASPSFLNVPGSPYPKSNSEYPPVPMNPHDRALYIKRFHEKRLKRDFSKKIRYGVRHEVAKRMNRKKGQFASSKIEDEQTDSAGCQQSGTGATSGPVPNCVHCGTKSTPMMRKGPAGPRTLCNACGLMWATKGVLRDLSKSGSSSGLQEQQQQQQQQKQQEQQIPLKKQQAMVALQDSLNHLTEATVDSKDTTLNSSYEKKQPILAAGGKSARQWR